MFCRGEVIAKTGSDEDIVYAEIGKTFLHEGGSQYCTCGHIRLTLDVTQII